MGTDSFSYTIQDLSGATSTATVNLNISQTSSLPVTDGLVLQLDANSGVTTDSSGIVIAWSDQSAVGNDLTSVTGDPTLITNALNGNNVVRLDGDGDKLERLSAINLPGDNTDRSIFMVAQYNSTGSGGFSYGRARTNRTFGLMSAEMAIWLSKHGEMPMMLIVTSMVLVKVGCLNPLSWQIAR
ncbi:MAG: hypothetical protein AAFO04_24415 [Cyanobacteria bacterium J06592_8]